MTSPVVIELARGLKISSDPSSDCILTAPPDGISSSDVELGSLEHALLSGGSVFGARAKMRRITLQFILPDKSWHEVSSLFPLGRSELILIRTGKADSSTEDGDDKASTDSSSEEVRYIRGYRDGPIVPLDKTPHSTPHVQVSFLCPSPFFTRDATQRKYFMEVEGGLTYPKKYPFRYGKFESFDSVFCENSGDYLAPFVLDLVSSIDGTLTVTIGTQALSVRDIKVGDVISIDTDRRMLTVNGARRLDMFSGDFARIPVGGEYVRLGGFVGLAQIAYSEIFEGGMGDGSLPSE